MQNITVHPLDIVTSYGLNVILAIIIALAGQWGAKILTRLFHSLLERAKLDRTVVSFLSNVAYYIILIVVAITALNQLGIQTTSLIAVLGAAGLAVGLALQNSLANFASGLLLIVFKPFQAGHVIQGGGVSGTVEEIQMLTTRLRSPDNVTIIVPNAKLTSDSIINYSAKEQRRVEIPLRVSYNADLQKAKRILKELTDVDSRILKEPVPVIAVTELAPSSVNLALRVWVKTENYADVSSDLNETVKARFQEEDVTIAFAWQDLRSPERKV
jgi:small conductance mechanosensitive channel